MFILQHVWSRWTKRTRDGADAGPRLANAEAYRLQLPERPEPAWLHDIRALEDDGFQPAHAAGPLTDLAWAHTSPMHAANLRWRLHRDHVELTLTEPWEGMRRTPWPAHLPSPISVVRTGEVVRIDWNGRFMASAAGSNRSFYYDQHTYWITVADDPAPDIFLTATPRKHIDLRTRIY